MFTVDQDTSTLDTTVAKSSKQGDGLSKPYCHPVGSPETIPRPAASPNRTRNGLAGDAALGHPKYREVEAAH
ncbi:hypothetical protein PG994_002296 [Apiospora phragmitis]|uniref:Uncharacterized protein n=1 Tax=Apiospora phragmitis TaxID=2905665 RepID=A0ABR1WVY7_9PEZI